MPAIMVAADEVPHQLRAVAPSKSDRKAYLPLYRSQRETTAPLPRLYGVALHYERG
jgi:hypothetical protein